MGRGVFYWDRDRSKSTARRRMLQQMIDAEDSGDRRKIDEALVAAKRWLGDYGFDWAVLDGCDRLRGALLPPTAVKEGDPP